MTKKTETPRGREVRRNCLRGSFCLRSPSLDWRAQCSVLCLNIRLKMTSIVATKKCAESVNG